MSEQLQLRRGTAAQVAAFTGAQGEVVVDTTNNRLVIQDGTTAGGFAAAKLAEIVPAGGSGQVAALGIGTAADPANPLSVTADNVLFNELSASSGGTGDVRVKLNKAAATNTASLLYQDGFSGRAEIGLCGDDNFHFKVSPDGSTWSDALDIASSSGVVTATFGLVAASGLFNSTGTPLSLPGACQLYSTASGPNLLIVESYAATGPTPAYVGRGARGTAAAPSALQANDTLLAFGGRGYGATGFSSSNRTKINFAASQNWTDTAQGSYINFLVTANNTTTPAEAARFDQSGYLGVGTTTPQCSVDVNGLIRTASYTVTTLPAASSSLTGARAYVTDASSPTFLGTLTGGGSTKCPVFCDGSVWRAG
ncbi:MAG: hypothetical protein P4L68_05480 [Methylovirgula sp.]|nr:hypothetical protein [Methylovirgula sp.]